ncbi:hypothetical protein PybrP1_012948 [[Pythium] brassicae (nom. inval.)]|nr:hypothetical protein PybrP1_012948 [[Pythium] brassicae (nom. inval.)]
MSSTAQEPSPPAPSSSPALAAAVAVSGGVNRKGLPKKFHRILWDSDAATRGGKTSIGVLLEWLSAPGNYERWRDGKTQFGETREALCSQIKAEMARHGITHRENANIRTQMSELERSYDNAIGWLAQGGYDGRLPAGDAASGADIEAQVLRLCRYFHALDPVMGAAASAARSPAPALVRGRQRRSLGRPGKPTGASAGSEDGDSEQRQRGDRGDSDRSAVESPVTTPAEASDRAVVDTLAPIAPALAAEEEDAMGVESPPPVLLAKRKAPSSPAFSAVSGGTTATTDSTFSSDSLSASTPAVLQAPVASPEPAPAPGLPSGASSAGARLTDEPRDSSSLPGHTTLSPQTAAAVWQAADSDPVGYGNAQRAMFEAAREERERKRFRMDEERNKLECEKLRYELQVAKLKLQVERALARKKLEKADLTPAEVIAAVEL